MSHDARKAAGFETHFEEFLHLAGLGHDKALIAWGGFRRGDSPYRCGSPPIA